jgi:hypothetical protein
MKNRRRRRRRSKRKLSCQLTQMQLALFSPSYLSYYSPVLILLKRQHDPVTAIRRTAHIMLQHIGSS